MSEVKIRTSHMKVTGLSNVKQQPQEASKPQIPVAKATPVIPAPKVPVVDSGPAVSASPESPTSPENSQSGSGPEGSAGATGGQDPTGSIGEDGEEQEGPELSKGKRRKLRSLLEGEDDEALVAFMNENSLFGGKTGKAARARAKVILGE